jgi:hypothetical protein
MRKIFHYLEEGNRGELAMDFQSDVFPAFGLFYGENVHFGSVLL